MRSACALCPSDDSTLRAPCGRCPGARPTRTHAERAAIGLQRALETRIAVSRFGTRAPLTQWLITAWVRPDATARSFFRFTAAGLTAGRTFATRPLTTEATQFGQPDSQRIQPLISYARFKANRPRSGERRGRRIDMHIDQRREPGPPIRESRNAAGARALRPYASTRRRPSRASAPRPPGQIRQAGTARGRSFA